MLAVVTSEIVVGGDVLAALKMVGFVLVGLVWIEAEEDNALVVASGDVVIDGAAVVDDSCVTGVELLVAVLV